VNQQNDNSACRANANLFQAFQPSIDAAHFALDAFVSHGTNVNVAVNFGLYI